TASRGSGAAPRRRSARGPWHHRPVPPRRPALPGRRPVPGRAGRTGRTRPPGSAAARAPSRDACVSPSVYTWDAARSRVGPAFPGHEHWRTVVNMSVHPRTPEVSVRVKRPLLDVVAEVLVADPAAALAEVAAAAGIGRTTLHKHYATRDDLVTAVAHRAIDLW